MALPLKTISADRPLAYLFFAFIAMSGLAYVNFLPGLVNALAGALGFSEAEAGQIVALNGYGGIVGSTAAIFLVRRISWRPISSVLLLALALIDLATIWVKDYGTMLSWRALAGLVGGLVVGIAFSVLARLKSPDRGFGSLLFIQFGIGSLVIYLLPRLEAVLGAYAVFYAMSMIATLAWVFVCFLPNFPAESAAGKSEPSSSAARATMLLLMVGMFLYLLAASAIWAYVGLIGLTAGMSTESVSVSIAATGLLGPVGAMLPVISGKRFGRRVWVTSGVALSTISAVMLIYSEVYTIYVLAMSLLFFAWPAVQSYLLAVTAEMDTSGQLSTVGSVVASVGLASGPLVASSLLGEGEYSIMLCVSAAIFLLAIILLAKSVQVEGDAT